MEELRKIDVHYQVTSRDTYDSAILERVKELNKVRSVLYKAGGIGFDNDSKMHYGNLSGKIDKKRFLCRATNTSGVNPEREEIGEEFYPIVFINNNPEIYSVGIRADSKPSIEAATHRGFYSGNKDIGCVAHCHHQGIHRYYRGGGKGAIVWGEEVICGSKEIMDAAYNSGKDERILGNESEFGRWGIAVPGGHSNSVFIAGENPNVVLLGFLKSMGLSGIEALSFSNQELGKLSWTEEDLERAGKVYLPE